ncbi:MAG TPA: alpha-1,2-fucosyltransferase [Bacteroidia bacterium]|jgi:hypothetical protein|nr:alpha-1,2-fucosyltransferase [Bacteroidia bacterium]
MIVSRIYGGMGNQMFQYAYGRMLTAKHQTVFKIYFDDCGFGWAEHSKKLTLSKFNISAQLATEADRSQFICDSSNKVTRVIHKLGRLRKGLHYIGDGARVHDYHLHALNAPDNSFTDGFWQSEIYFDSIAPIIKKEFTIKEPLSAHAKQIEKQINESNAVSIHVRRGDYLEQTAVYWICNVDYYQRALEVVKKRTQDIVVFIFSNDAEWVKLNLKLDATIVVVENTRAYEDMHLMSCCKHNISSNSTFGWWGAWLNNNPDKIVILPERWLADSSVDTSHYTAKGWLRV